VGQEPQEFSVRLPIPFYRVTDGLANCDCRATRMPEPDGAASIDFRGTAIQTLGMNSRRLCVGTVGTGRNCGNSGQSARVAELADAPDLGSGAERRGGSSPPSRTTHAGLRSARIAGEPAQGSPRMPWKRLGSPGNIVIGANSCLDNPSEIPRNAH
jgi:hypothetical protein